MPLPPTALPSVRAINWASIVLSLAFFLTPLVGATGPTLVQDTLKSALMSAGIVFAGMALLWHRWQAPVDWHGNTHLHGHPALLAPAVLALYACASMAWSHPYLAAVEAIRWALIGLLAWLGMNAVRPRDLNLLLLSIHAGMAFAALWAAGQFWFDFSAFEQGPGPAATFYNRNFYAEFSICVLPYSGWLLARTRNRCGQWALSLSIAFNLATLFMTSTRSALLALALLMPLLLALAWRHYRQAPSAARKSIRWRVLVGLGLWLTLVNLPSNGSHIDTTIPHITAWQRSVHHTAELGEPGGLNAGSASVRRQLWLATLRMLKAHPIMGVGAGAWEIQVPRYQNADTEVEIDYFAHNEFLQLLSEYGLLAGGLVLALLLALAIQWAQRGWRVRAHEPEAIYPLLALLAFAIVAMAGFPLHLAGTGGLFALSLGLLCRSAPISTPEAAPATTATATAAAPVTHRNRRLLAGLIALGLASLATAYLTQRAVRAEQTLVNALDLAARLPRNAAPMDGATQQRKNAMLAALHSGIALNPHYRQFFPVAAEVLMTEQDWANAAWVLEAAVASRPHVYALWKGLAQARIGLRDGPGAVNAVNHLRALRPSAWTTQLLAIEALSIAGDETQALELTRASMAHASPGMEEELFQAGYVMGLKHQDRELALHALALRAQYWPSSAADSYLQTGNVYATMAPIDAQQALRAYSEGLRHVPASDRPRYLALVPMAYQKLLKPVPAH